MPYITSDKVREMRIALKAKFPKFKLSITREHCTTVNVAIISAPIEMRVDVSNTNESVNHYYIEDHYKDNPEIRDILLGIKEILCADCRTITEDGDYGSIPNYYYNISVGKWNQPFMVK